MKLYDECLLGVLKLLKEYQAKELDISVGNELTNDGKNRIIFQSDTAYELGGGALPAVSSIALTDSEEYVENDGIYLIGDDLPDIKKDVPFARIALIRVDENSLGSGEALYQSIRKIEFTRYHLNPEGYMMRISAFTHREAVRISKTALKNGLSFSKVGKLFIDEYKKNLHVKAVKLLFVTKSDFPYDKLEVIMQKSEDITKALDHIMKNIKMDCDACSLKAVCDEVEALCDKDFPKSE